MVIDDKTTQINTFSGGMNTDTSDALIDDKLYRFAKNVRFVTDTDSNTGELHLIKGVTQTYKFPVSGCTLLKATLCRDMGVLIVKDADGAWAVYKFTGEDAPLKVFGWCTDLLGNNLSVVTRYEDTDNQKLYIADGLHGVLVIDLTYTYDDKGTINEVRSIPAGYFKKPIFGGLVPGTLKAGTVQYSYQFYNKHRLQSEISPATRLIPIIKGNMSDKIKDVEGYELDSSTDKGVKLSIPVNDKAEMFDHIKIYRITYVEAGLLPTIECIYDGLIDALKEIANRGSYEFIDTGTASLSVLTLEEYNSMTGVHITPSVVESKNDYLFAAGDKLNTIAHDQNFIAYDSRSFSFDINKKSHLHQYDNTSDVTVISSVSLAPSMSKDCYNIYTDMSKEYTENVESYSNGEGDRFDLDGYYGGSGANIDWRFVVTEITGDASSVRNKDIRWGRMGSNTVGISIDDDITFSPKNIKVAYVKSDGKLSDTKTIDASDYFNTSEANSTYANPSVAYFMKSLRRDEVYRYGIVFYDDQGDISPVKWIADIRTPNMYWQGFNTFVSHGQKSGDSYEDLVVRPLGIEFNVKKLPKLKSGNTIIGYEIVRCARTITDIATISQGVISRPVRSMVNLNTNIGLTWRGNLTPQGVINSNILYICEKELNEWMNLDSNVKQWDLGLGAFNGSLIDQEGYKSDNGVDESGKSLSKEEILQRNDFHRPNFNIYLFISPEICCTQTSVKQLLNKRDITLHPLMYLFGSGYRENTDSSFVNKKQFNRKKQAKSRYIIRPFANTPYHLALVDDARSIGWPHSIARELTLSEKTANKILKGESETDDEFAEQKDSYGYIKYYESTNNVCINDQINNPLYKYSGQDYKGLVTFSDSTVKRQMVNNDGILIKDVSWPDDLNWDDFLLSSKEDDKTHWNVQANEKLTAVGNDNFNNWTFNGYDPMPYEKQEYTWDPVYWANDGKMGDGNNILGENTGAGGRTMLINLDIDRNHLINNTNFAISHYVTTDKLTDIGLELASGTVSTSFGGWHADDILNGGGGHFGTGRSSLTTRSSKTWGTGSGKPDYYVENGTNVPLYRNSILGTYLCNIRHTVTPYGGSSNMAKSLNTYTSYGDYFDTTGQHVIFDGDCFIEPFEYVSMHKVYHSKVKYLRTAAVINSIPVETNMNLFCQYGYIFSKDPQSLLLVKASNVNNEWIQKKDMYVYNQAYSLNTNVRQYAAYNQDNNDLDNTDYRCYYSNLKENNENIDSWLKFMSSNYLDADTLYGPITELRTFKDRLFFWQKNATGIFSVNERATITDLNNEPLILGTGGVMTRYDYISNTNGMREGEFADAQSDSTLYWWDHDNAEIVGYNAAGGIAILSKTKYILNYINYREKNADLNDKPILYYDRDFNEVVFNIFKEDGSIMYSELSAQFISSLDTHPAGIVITPKHLYIIRKDGSVHNWNDGKDIPVNEDNTAMLPYVDLVVNKNALYTKVFDNGSLSGKTFGRDSKDSDKTIDKIRLTFDTPIHQHSRIESDQISSKELNFDYRIPRAFDKDGNEAAYGERLRGKNMHIIVDTSEPTSEFSLSWVITKYRISWA